MGVNNVALHTQFVSALHFIILDATCALVTDGGNTGRQLVGEPGPQCKRALANNMMHVVNLQWAAAWLGDTAATVDHFYSDAVAELSDRMRRLAYSLDLYVN